MPAYSLSSNITRRVKSSQFEVTSMHGFAMAIFNRFGSEQFTMKEAQEVLDNKNPYYSLQLLSDAGVLEAYKPGLRKENLYRLIPPFSYSENNLKLLSFIPEFQNKTVSSKDFTDELISSARANVNVVKEAIGLFDKGVFDISLLGELSQHEEIKFQFLMGVISQDLVGLYKTFSKIEIRNAGLDPKVNIDYNAVNNSLMISLPGYPFDFAYEDDRASLLLMKTMGIGVDLDSLEIRADNMWKWIGTPEFKRELIYAVVQGDIMFEALLTPLEGLLLGNLRVSIATLPLPEEVDCIDFLANIVEFRNHSSIKQVYREFLNVEKEILKIKLQAMDQLTFDEKKIIVLKYGLEDGQMRTTDQVAEILQLSIERVRQITISALEKIRDRGFLEEIEEQLIPYQDQLREALEMLYQELLKINP
ncbi:MAG: sigma factor-like helix-turn-helix DNA-binding protein [Candidatus Saelkia tenebricola]|nr:sigma factor-like helix-turn-helix DNA-binding protein [Candidatus Saelkia tenebricola]